MNEQAITGRIVMHPSLYGGKPVLRDPCVPVDQVLQMLEADLSAEQIIEDTPGLERDDIRACLAFARNLVRFEHEGVESRVLDIAA